MVHVWMAQLPCVACNQIVFRGELRHAAVTINSSSFHLSNCCQAVWWVVPGMPLQQVCRQRGEQWCPDPPFKIGAPRLLYKSNIVFLKCGPLSGFCISLLLNPGDGPALQYKCFCCDEHTSSLQYKAVVFNLGVARGYFSWGLQELIKIWFYSLYFVYGTTSFRSQNRITWQKW